MIPILVLTTGGFAQVQPEPTGTEIFLFKAFLRDKLKGWSLNNGAVMSEGYCGGIAPKATSTGESRKKWLYELSCDTYTKNPRKLILELYSSALTAQGTSKFDFFGPQLNNPGCKIGNLVISGKYKWGDMNMSGRITLFSSKKFDPFTENSWKIYNLQILLGAGQPQTISDPKEKC